MANRAISLRSNAGKISFLLGGLLATNLVVGCSSQEEQNNAALDSSRAAQTKAMRGGGAPNPGQLPHGGPPKGGVPPTSGSN